MLPNNQPDAVHSWKDLCPKCREWHPGDGTHICLDKSREDLKRELSLIQTLAAQRNRVIGEMGEQIERLKQPLVDLGHLMIEHDWELAYGPTGLGPWKFWFRDADGAVVHEAETLLDLIRTAQGAH